MNLRLFKIFYQKWWFGTPGAPPYKHVVQIGDPVLRQQAKPVNQEDIQSPSMKELYTRLRYLMKITNAVGLAAPQVGISLRVFAIQFPKMKNYPSPTVYEKKGMEHIPFQIWVNPVMKILDYDKIYDEECCESMKGFSATVPRFKRVLLTGLDEYGNNRSWETKNWSARLVQHEMDHLDGKFYVDTMIPKTLSCTNWSAINYHEGRIYTTYIPKS